jgi:hypothetical protein
MHRVAECCTTDIVEDWNRPSLSSRHMIPLHLNVDCQQRERRWVSQSDDSGKQSLLRSLWHYRMTYIRLFVLYEINENNITISRHLYKKINSCNKTQSSILYITTPSKKSCFRDRVNQIFKYNLQLDTRCFAWYIKGEITFLVTMQLTVAQCIEPRKSFLIIQLSDLLQKCCI